MLRRNSRLIGRSPSHIVRPIQWDHAKGCFRLRSTSPRQDPPSLYQVLGAQEGATPEEIKAAFRRKARDLHPDVNPLVSLGFCERLLLVQVPLLDCPLHLLAQSIMLRFATIGARSYVAPPCPRSCQC